MVQSRPTARSRGARGTGLLPEAQRATGQRKPVCRTPSERRPLSSQSIGADPRAERPVPMGPARTDTSRRP